MNVEQVVLEKLNAIERGQRLLKDGQKKTIELLDQLVGKEQDRAEADGPFPPNRFRFRGVMYTMSAPQWNLLICLWGREPRKIEDIEDELYGHDHKKTKAAVPSLFGRLNKRLLDQSCPVSVHRQGGYLVLDLERGQVRK